MRFSLMLTGILAAGLVFGGLRMNTSAGPAVAVAVSPSANASHLPATVAPVLQRACRDCHSNGTVWPWYSHVPPLSFMIKHDVEGGRAKFNFSRWADGSAKPTANQVQEICDAASDGSMPPKGYRMMHRESRLRTGDVDILCHWAQVARTGETITVGNSNR